MSTRTEVRVIVTDGHGREATLPGPFASIEAIKRNNAANGYHWFSRESMGFFDSRVESNVIHGRLFVSSEQYHPADADAEDGPRRYTIRIAHDNGTTGDLGAFQQYETREEAVAAAYRAGLRHEPATYRLIRRPAEGLALVQHPSGAVDLWARTKLRKPRKCSITERPMEPGTAVYRPVGNQQYRGARIDAAVIDAHPIEPEPKEQP